MYRSALYKYTQTRIHTFPYTLTHTPQNQNDSRSIQYLSHEMQQVLSALNTVLLEDAKSYGYVPHIYVIFMNMIMQAYALTDAHVYSHVTCLSLTYPLLFTRVS